MSRGRAGEWGLLEHFGVRRFSFANPRAALWEFFANLCLFVCSYDFGQISGASFLLYLAQSEKFAFN